MVNMARMMLSRAARAWGKASSAVEEDHRLLIAFERGKTEMLFQFLVQQIPFV